MTWTRLYTKSSSPEKSITEALSYLHAKEDKILSRSKLAITAFLRQPRFSGTQNSGINGSPLNSVEQN
jgi:hypothetical protein